MCLGVFSVGLGSLLLGFTTDYYTALTIRIVSGLFNNMTAMLKCMIAEMAGENQAQAMAYFSVAWTTGTLLGPSMAGILAMPCQQYVVCPFYSLPPPFPLSLPHIRSKR